MKKKLSSSLLALSMVFNTAPSLDSITEVFADSVVEPAVAIDSNVDVVGEIYSSFASTFGANVISEANVDIANGNSVSSSFISAVVGTTSSFSLTYGTATPSGFMSELQGNFTWFEDASKTGSETVDLDSGAWSYFFTNDAGSVAVAWDLGAASTGVFLDAGTASMVLEIGGDSFDWAEIGPSYVANGSDMVTMSFEVAQLPLDWDNAFDSANFELDSISASAWSVATGSSALDDFFDSKLNVPSGITTDKELFTWSYDDVNSTSTTFVVALSVVDAGDASSSNYSFDEGIAHGSTFAFSIATETQGEDEITSPDMDTLVGDLTSIGDSATISAASFSFGDTPLDTFGNSYTFSSTSASVVSVEMNSTSDSITLKALADGTATINMLDANASDSVAASWAFTIVAADEDEATFYTFDVTGLENMSIDFIGATTASTLSGESFTVSVSDNYTLPDSIDITFDGGTVATSLYDYSSAGYISFATGFDAGVSFGEISFIGVAEFDMAGALGDAFGSVTVDTAVSLGDTGFSFTLNSSDNITVDTGDELPNFTFDTTETPEDVLAFLVAISTPDAIVTAAAPAPSIAFDSVTELVPTDAEVVGTLMGFSVDTGAVSIPTLELSFDWTAPADKSGFGYVAKFGKDGKFTSFNKEYEEFSIAMIDETVGATSGSFTESVDLNNEQLVGVIFSDQELTEKTETETETTGQYVIEWDSDVEIVNPTENSTSTVDQIAPSSGFQLFWDANKNGEFDAGSDAYVDAGSYDLTFTITPTSIDWDSVIDTSLSANSVVTIKAELDTSNTTSLEQWSANSTVIDASVSFTVVADTIVNESQNVTFTFTDEATPYVAGGYYLVIADSTGKVVHSTSDAVTSSGDRSLSFAGVDLKIDSTYTVIVKDATGKVYFYDNGYKVTDGNTTYPGFENNTGFLCDTTWAGVSFEIVDGVITVTATFSDAGGAVDWLDDALAGLGITTGTVSFGTGVTVGSTAALSIGIGSNSAVLEIDKDTSGNHYITFDADGAEVSFEFDVKTNLDAIFLADLISNKITITENSSVSAGDTVSGITNGEFASDSMIVFTGTGTFPSTAKLKFELNSVTVTNKNYAIATTTSSLWDDTGITVNTESTLAAMVTRTSSGLISEANRVSGGSNYVSGGVGGRSINGSKWAPVITPYSSSSGGYGSSSNTGSSSGSSSSGSSNSGSVSTGVGYNYSGNVSVNGTYINELRGVLVGEMVNLTRITTVNGQEVLGWYYDPEFTQPVSNPETFVFTSSVISNGLYAKTTGSANSTLADGSTNAGAGGVTSGAASGGTTSGNTSYTPSVVPSTVAKILSKLF